MTRRAGRITIVVAIIGALGGAALIVARAPRPVPPASARAAYGH